MGELFPKLVELLGRSIDDSLVRTWIRGLEELPEHAFGAYMFPRSGIGLVFDRARLVLVVIHFATPATNTGWVTPFSGSILGIVGGDDRNQVRAKLAGCPLSMSQSEGARYYRIDDIVDDLYSSESIQLVTGFWRSTGVLSSIVLESKSDLPTDRAAFVAGFYKVPKRRKLASRIRRQKHST
jgi:hypothetical protein